ncbi:unnamed protein product, partial [Mesorhabditis belari]|uniref:G-protein coupled receptors family 1 profile domain-containing protein n=1 Tax=Mesorhabditis belari TaxID=2138241 RepID=A0AAF3FEU7_9BILA
MHVPIHVVTTIYVMTFVIGVPGNCWVIGNLLRNRLCATGGTSLSPSHRTRLFIFILAISDLLLLLTIPAVILFIQTADWLLGSFLCHVHLAVDIFAKLFSVVVLTAMSLERYFIVCTRWRHSFKKGLTTAIPMCLALLLFVIVPMAVQIHYTTIIEIALPASMDLSAPTEQPYQIHRLCVPGMSDRLFNLFAHYMFLTGFFLPLLIMTTCYILLMRHVRRKFRMRCEAGGASGRSIREPRYMGEVRKSIWRIAIYHFVCWAPFWTVTLIPMLVANMELNSPWMFHPVWRALQLFINILPNINAAGNWILYAFLNRDVRRHLYVGKPSNKSKTTLIFSSMTI